MIESVIIHTMDIINTIHNDDCLNLMAKMPESCVDLTVTSPPYDEMRDYKGYCFAFEPMAKELLRVTKDGGVVVWVVGDMTVDGTETGSSLRQALYFMSIGFNLHDTMIFGKNTSSFPATEDDVRYTQIFEYMFILSKGKPKTINLIRDKLNKYYGKKNWGDARKRNVDGSFKDITLTKQPTKQFGIRNNIWYYVVSGGQAHTDLDAYEHPATFPEKLAEDHILSWSNKGDLVFDPMAGSGTTLIMAKKHQRNFLGCEMSQEYFELIQRRMKKSSQYLPCHNNPFFG